MAKKVVLAVHKRGGKCIQAIQQLVDCCLANNTHKIEVVRSGDADKKVCEWVPSRHCHDTSCGVVLAHKHLNFNFCPYCGLPIKEKEE